jgi:hypothetical protein
MEKLPESIHTRFVILQTWSNVLNCLVYRPSALKLLDVQAAVAKQGCKAKMAMDAAHRTVDSTTKLV